MNEPTNYHYREYPYNKYKHKMSKKPSNPRYFDDDDEDDEDYESRKARRKEAQPRFIKNRVDNVDAGQIVVNLSKTHYDVIEIVVEELGWVAEYSKKSQKWDIFWTDYHIDAQDLFRLNDHQKISHFPAIEVLSKKNFLGRSLMKMGKLFPQEYQFFPPTWSVPSELGQLMRFDSQHPEDDKLVYIFKPQAASQGKGISLISNLQQIEGRTGIVQTYINNPYLIEGLKFDLRIYVLIYGSDPTRIYIYEEGLARFATEPYKKAKKKNLKDNYVHLTNYAINKNNKKFVFNTSDKQMNVGHKRSLTSIFNILKRKQVDVAGIKRKIDALIVKTLLVGKPMISHLYGLSQTDNLANDHCFHILGFDVMLDEHLEPLLLEVNHTPSFATDTPLDKSIKKNLIKQTLLLLNVNLRTKKIKIEKKRQFQEKRAMRKLVKLTPEQKQEQKKLIEKEKNAHEAVTLNKYRKLYPLESNEYVEIEEMAQRIFNEQCGIKSKEGSREMKETKEVFSTVRTKVKQNSIQQMTTESKLFKRMARNSNSLAGGSSPILPEKGGRLPDISPRRNGSEKTSLMSPQKSLIKSYEFNPEMVFAQFSEKANIHKVFLKQRIMAMQQLQQPHSTAFVERQRRSDRRYGGYLEPKVHKLAENLPTPLNMFEDVSIDLNSRTIVKKEKEKEKIRHRNFKQFTKQKGSDIFSHDLNSVLLVRKEGPKKNLSNRVPSKVQFEDYEQTTDKLTFLKKLLSTKPSSLA